MKFKNPLIFLIAAVVIGLLAVFTFAKSDDSTIRAVSQVFQQPGPDISDPPIIPPTDAPIVIVVPPTEEPLPTPPTPIRLPPEPAGSCNLAPAQTTQQVNVRPEPSTESEPIGVLGFNWYPTDGVPMTDKEGNIWYQVDSSGIATQETGWVAGIYGGGTVTQLSSGCEAPPPPDCTELGITVEQISELPTHIQEAFRDNCVKLLEIIRDRGQRDIQRVVLQTDVLFEQCPLTLVGLLGHLQGVGPAEWNRINDQLAKSPTGACQEAESILQGNNSTDVPFTPTKEAEVTETPAPPQTTPCVSPVTNPRETQEPEQTPEPGRECIFVTEPVITPDTVTPPPIETGSNPQPAASETPSAIPTDSTSVPPPSPTPFVWPAGLGDATGIYTARSSNGSVNLYAYINGGAVELPISGNIAYPIINFENGIVYFETVENKVSLQWIDFKIKDGQREPQQPIPIFSSVEAQSMGLILSPAPIVWWHDYILVSLNDSGGNSSIYKLNVLFSNGTPQLMFSNARYPAYNPEEEMIAYEDTADGAIDTVSDAIIEAAELDGTTITATSLLGLKTQSGCTQMISPAWDYRTRALFFQCEISGELIWHRYYANEISGQADVEPLEITQQSVINNLAALPGGFLTFDNGQNIFVVQLDDDHQNVMDVTPLELPGGEIVTSMNWTNFPELETP